MILRGVGRLVGAVNFEQVASSEFVTFLAWVVKVEALLALGGKLTHDVDAVVNAIEEKFAVFSMWSVEHPGSL